MHKVRARTINNVENKSGGKGGREDSNSTVDNDAAFTLAAKDASTTRKMDTGNANFAGKKSEDSNENHV